MLDDIKILSIEIDGRIYDLRAEKEIKIIDELSTEEKKLSKKIQDIDVKTKDETITKICNTCKKSKQIDKFSLRKDSKDGHQTICKECHNKYGKQHRIKIKENKMIIKTPRVEKPEIKISDGSLPLTDSSTVFKDSADEKISNKWKPFWEKNKC